MSTLAADRTQAGEQYEQIRHSLILFFTFRGATDPHELADETINRAAGRLREGAAISTQNPASYFYGIARNVWRELRAQPVTTEPLDDDTPLRHSVTATPQELLEHAEQKQDYERRLRCLENCLQSLAAQDRELIMEYYQGEGGIKIEHRQDLAARFNISLKTLRNKTSKLRGEIAECVKKCLAGTN